MFKVLKTFDISELRSTYVKDMMYFDLEIEGVERRQ